MNYKYMAATKWTITEINRSERNVTEFNRSEPKQ